MGERAIIVDTSVDSPNVDCVFSTFMPARPILANPDDRICSYRPEFVFCAFPDEQYQLDGIVNSAKFVRGVRPDGSTFNIGVVSGRFARCPPSPQVKFCECSIPQTPPATIPA